MSSVSFVRSKRVRIRGDLDYDFSVVGGFFLLRAFCEKKYAFHSNFLDLQYDDRSYDLWFYSPSGVMKSLSFNNNDSRYNLVAFSLFVSFIAAEIGYSPYSLYLDLVSGYDFKSNIRRKTSLRDIHFKSDFIDVYLEEINRKVDRVCVTQCGWSNCNPEFIPMSPIGDKSIFDISRVGYQIASSFVRTEYHGFGFILRRDPPSDPDFIFDKFKALGLFLVMHTRVTSEEDYGLVTVYYTFYRHYGDKTNRYVLFTGVAYGLNAEHAFEQAEQQSYKKLCLAPDFYLGMDPTDHSTIGLQ